MAFVLMTTQALPPALTILAFISFGMSLVWPLCRQRLRLASSVLLVASAVVWSAVWFLPTLAFFWCCFSGWWLP